MVQKTALIILLASYSVVYAQLPYSPKDVAIQENDEYILSELRRKTSDVQGCIDNPTFCVDSVNNRVGINISSPTGDLHIVGGAAVLVVQRTGSSPSINFSSGTTPFGLIEMNTSGDISIQPPGITALSALGGSGNIGIKGTNPSSALEVIGGSVTIRNPYGLQIGTTVVVQQGNPRIGFWNTSPVYGLDVSTSARITGETMLATTSGNVGLGTTNASASLHISKSGSGAKLFISSSTPVLNLNPGASQGGVYTQIADVGAASGASDPAYTLRGFTSGVQAQMSLVNGKNLLFSTGGNSTGSDNRIILAVESNASEFTPSNVMHLLSTGNVWINQTSAKLIMTSPDGSCSQCGPDNSDVWSCSSVTCP